MAVVIHEFLHFLVAKILHVNAKLKINSFFTPVIYYKNPKSDIKTLLIAILSPMLMILLGLTINKHLNYLIAFKIVCLSNFLNLLPVTGDGEIIFMSIFNLIKKGRK